MAYTVLEENLRREFKEREERGERRGERRGIERGLATEREWLRDQASRKFGDAVAARVSALLAGTGDTDGLHRVGGWLMDLRHRRGTHRAPGRCTQHLIASRRGCTSAFASLAVLPLDAAIPLLLAVVLIVGLVTYAVRGIYWATLERCDVPDHVKGLAVGVISLVGYAPDIYLPLLRGALWTGCRASGATGFTSL